MPQMAPIWWTSLFIMFVLSLMTMHNMTYYLLNMSPLKEAKSMKNKTQVNWKW